MDVGMMAASDVATATCMRYSSGTPAKRSEYSSTGTVTMPPPTPSIPAAKPATTPESARMAISGRISAKLALAALRCFAEGMAGAAGQRGMDLAHDGQRDGLRRASAEVQAHRRAQPRTKLHGVGAQVAEQFFAPRGWTQQAHVGHAAVRQRAQVMQVGIEVVAHDHRGRELVEWHAGGHI